MTAIQEGSVRAAGGWGVVGGAGQTVAGGERQDLRMRVEGQQEWLLLACRLEHTRSQRRTLTPAPLPFVPGVRYC